MKNCSKEEKEKKQAYGRKCYKNLSKSKKMKNELLSIILIE